MKWLKDQKTEANLRALGVAYSAEKVSLANVDLAEGLRKQTRLLGKLNDDYVLQLSVAMTQPEAAFPMTILQRLPRQKLYPFAGNHRLAAFSLAFPDEGVIEAYVVEVKDARMQDILPRITNAWESGLGFSKEEKIINARWLVDNHSMPIAEAARLVGIPSKWLEKAKRAEDVRDIIVGLGVRGEKLPRSILTLLAPLDVNSNVIKQTAKVLIDSDIRGTEAIHLINDVKGQRTELQQMAELGRWEKLIAERTKVANGKAKIKFSHSVRDGFIRHLTGLAKLLDKHRTLEQLQCTDPADRDIVARNWIAVAKQMAIISQGGAK